MNRYLPMKISVNKNEILLNIQNVKNKYTVLMLKFWNFVSYLVYSNYFVGLMSRVKIKRRISEDNGPESLIN